MTEHNLKIINKCDFKRVFNNQINKQIIITI